MFIYFYYMHLKMLEKKNVSHLEWNEILNSKSVVDTFKFFSSPDPKAHKVSL